MKFTLTIDMDNAAFGEDDNARSDEVARILRKYATYFDSMGLGSHSGAIHDFNGNIVGSWEVSL